MQTLEQIDGLIRQSLWMGWALGFVLGYVMHRTHFCTLGAISDVLNFSDWGRLKSWALALGIALMGFAALTQMEWIDAGKSIYAGRRWLWFSALLGGGMFGFGMVLASGCGSKMLVRLGSGNLKSLCVLLVMGLSAWMTLKGLTAVLRVNWVDALALNVPFQADWPHFMASMTAISEVHWRLGLSLVLGGVLFYWALHRPAQLGLDNALGGIVVGLSIVAAWCLNGYWAHVSEHPETLQESFLITYSGRMESVTFAAPVAHTLDWLVFFSDKNKVLTFGVVCVLGVVLGAAVAAFRTRSFRWEGFQGLEDTATHLIGAVLMGVGGVTAMGCSIGQGLSGLSTLNLTSCVAVAALAMGAVLALRFQSWRLSRD